MTAAMAGVEVHDLAHDLAAVIVLRPPRSADEIVADLLADGADSPNPDTPNPAREDGCDVRRRRAAGRARTNRRQRTAPTSEDPTDA